MNNSHQSNSSNQSGFTLIEILVVIGLIAILATIVIIAINPARQFAQARNSQRTSNVNAILNAVGQNIADNKGVFSCGTPPVAFTIPTGPTNIDDSGSADIGPCVTPTYIPALPFDPSTAGAKWTSATDYDTKYTIKRDGITQRITVCAPGGAETAIPGSTTICVER